MNVNLGIVTFDAIKQNESEISQIQFSFFLLLIDCLYHLQHFLFTIDPIEIWQIGSKDCAGEGLQKQ